MASNLKQNWIDLKELRLSPISLLSVENSRACSPTPEGQALQRRACSHMTPDLMTPEVFIGIVKFCCSFPCHSKQIFMFAPNFVFLTLHSFSYGGPSNHGGVSAQSGSAPPVLPSFTPKDNTLNEAKTLPLLLTHVGENRDNVVLLCNDLKSLCLTSN